MPITMSGATVTTDTRDSLLASTVDAGATAGGATANTSGLFGLGGASGASLAGITAEFASSASAAIDTYCANVQAKLDELEAVESSGAFKGEAISSALVRFIEGVKEVSISYLNKLKAAEAEIVNSVQTVYAQQDADISGDLGSDTGTIAGQSV